MGPETRHFFCISVLLGVRDVQSFSDCRSYERRSERALMTDERDHFPSSRAGAHPKLDERERKFALIFCAHFLRSSIIFNSTDFHIKSIDFPTLLAKRVCCFHEKHVNIRHMNVDYRL